MITQWETGTPQPYVEVLIYITFPNEIMVRPKISLGYMDDQGLWRTNYGRISGVVTHWHLLPDAPVINPVKRGEK